MNIFKLWLSDYAFVHPYYKLGLANLFRETFKVSLDRYIFAVIAKRVILFLFTVRKFFELSFKFANFGEVLDPFLFIEVHFVLDFNKFLLNEFLHFFKVYDFLLVLMLDFFLFPEYFLVVRPERVYLGLLRLQLVLLCLKLGLHQHGLLRRFVF